MPSRKRRQYPDSIFMALDGGRRYAFWRMYQAEGQCAELQHLNDVLRDRIETILPVLFELEDKVLRYGAHPEPFRTAYRLHVLIEQFLAGDPRHN